MLDFIITDSEAERLLLNRRAVVILGISATLSVCAIVLIFWRFNLGAMSSGARVTISWLGALSALGTVCLLAGMWLFWLKCHISSGAARKIWFFALLFGLSYGAVPYYLFAYVPAVRRKLRNSATQTAENWPRPEVPAQAAEIPRVNERRKLFGPFGWALVVGWALLFVTVAACFALPKAMSHLLRPVATYFVLWPASLILGSMIYTPILLFRVGRRRTSDPAEFSRTKRL